jgi:Rrf2 family protein
MIELAGAFDSGPIFMGDIAKRQGISRKYLHALLTELKSAGLVMSVRGAHGGYVLAKKPTEITVTDVFEALEGKLAIIDCVVDEEACSRLDGCQTRKLWKDVNSAMANVLNNATLADLASGENSAII